MKVQVYIKKVSDIYSLWNVKFYDYESLFLIYKEKFSYSSRYF